MPALPSMTHSPTRTSGNFAVAKQVVNASQKPNVMTNKPKKEKIYD